MTAPELPPARRWPSVSAIVSFVLVVVIIWAIFAGIRLNRAVGALRDAEEKIDELADIDIDSAFDDETGDKLDAIGVDLRKADDAVSGFVMGPVKLLPVIGRQVRSVDALSGTSADAMEALSALTDELSVQVERFDDPASRVDALRRSADALDETYEIIADPDLGPDEALIGSLRDARNELATELARAIRFVDDGRVATRGLADMLSGPTTYVLGAANNAEMRAGQGAVLSTGELLMENGAVLATEMRPSWRRNLTVSSVDIPDADLADRWGWLTDGQDWLLNFMSPRFPATAEHALEMWNDRADRPATGMVVLDPVALGAVLKVTGAVQTDAGLINADNVVDFFLNGQYQSVGFDDRAEALRRDSLADVAPSVVAALLTRDFEVKELLEELRVVAQGRHVLAWSSVAEEQRVWERLGIDGTYDDDSLAVNLINRGPNKLDYFTRMRADVTTAELDSGATEVTVVVTVTNRTPLGQPQYVAGPVEGSITPADAYRGILSISMPGRARNGRIVGVGDLTVAGRDGPSRVVATEVLIERDDSQVVEIVFELPASMRSMQLEPAARFPVERWLHEGETVQMDGSETIEW